MEFRNVRATIGLTPYVTQLEYNDGIFKSDEPVNKGGQNAGPSPDILLAGSLASCTAVTLRMYLDRKEWNADKIHVDVNITPEDSRTLFDCVISIEGEFDETQRTKLLRIANHCPVHKILSQPIEITTKFSQP